MSSWTKTFYNNVKNSLRNTYYISFSALCIQKYLNAFDKCIPKVKQYSKNNSFYLKGVLTKPISITSAKSIYIYLIKFCNNYKIFVSYKLPQYVEQNTKLVLVHSFKNTLICIFKRLEVVIYINCNSLRVYTYHPKFLHLFAYLFLAETEIHKVDLYDQFS